MSETSETGAEPPRRPRTGRRGRWLGGVALVLAAALSGTWIARRPIAEHFIKAELVKAGVPARYTIGDLAIGGQRLTNVVLGDPANPDLVADWVETRTGIGLSGPYLAGVRVGHVRLRGRLVDGRVSLGAIDKLLPAPSGKPFALPALDVDVADARMRLETPRGVVGVKLSGAGGLDDGFRGTLAAVAPTLKAGGCSLTGTEAAVKLRLDRARPTVSGPIRVAQVACEDARVTGVAADLDLALGAALDRWDGRARLKTGAGRGPGVAMAGADGTIAFKGNAASTGGRIDLTGTGVRGRIGAAKAVTLAGDYQIGNQVAFDGRDRKSVV